MPDRSYKDNTLLFTQRKTTTNVLYMLDQIHHEAHTDLAHIRKTYSANNMKQLFQKTETNNAISFLKTLKLYTKISRYLQ